MAVEQAVLVHDPAGLVACRRAAAVEDERLPHAEGTVVVTTAAAAPARHHHPVLPGGLPVPGTRGSVGPQARRELDAPPAEEVADAAAVLSALGRQQVPGLGLVQVDLTERGGVEAGVGHLRSEVMREQLLVSRPEPEARRQRPGRGASPVTITFHPESSVRIGVERSAGRECSAAGAGGCAGGLWRGGGVMMVRSKQPMERAIYSGRPRAGQQRRPQVSRAYLANCGCEKRYSVGREPASSAACLYVRVGTRVVMYVFVCTYKHVVDPRGCICMLLLQVTYYVCIGFFFLIGACICYSYK